MADVQLPFLTEEPEPLPSFIKVPGPGRPAPTPQPPAAGLGTADAVERSEEHADAAWKQEALAAIRKAALAFETLIVDEVWRFLSPDAQTHDLRAMGPMMVQAAKLGYIERVPDEYRKSNLKNHGTPRPVWRSRLYNKPLP